MKKLTLMTAVAAIISVSAANAQTNAAGGFNGPSTSITTIERALTMSDDTFVTLQGKIEQRVGDEKYTFRDATGVIEVEIDNDEWRGQVINQEDTVEIKGEVDKSWRKTEIDVSEISKINP